MPRVLYVEPLGQPCRAVMMLIAHLKLDDILIVSVEISRGEHLQDWFLKINPRHCLPTLDDNGFILWESRTIMRYLADTCPHGASVYPRTFEKRTLVNRALDEDATHLYKSITNYVYPTINMGFRPTEVAANDVHLYLGLLDYTLEKQPYITQGTLTIADFATHSLVTLLELTDFDFSKYVNLIKWIDRMKELPSFKVSSIFPSFKMSGDALTLCPARTHSTDWKCMPGPK